MMRAMGGWIEQRGPATFLVRKRDALGKTVTVGTRPTREAAVRLRDGEAALDAAEPDRSKSLLGLAPAWFDLRERRGMRGTASARSRWRTHVEPHPIASLDVDRIVRRDVLAWLEALETRGVGWGSRKACLDLVRGCLEWLRLDRELVHTNAAADVRVTRPADAHEQDGWTYLLPAEVARLAECKPSERPAMLLATIALGTGLRQGEQWNLELRDIHLDEAEPWLLVRWGSKGLPSKSGRMRRVPLFGLALAALREWLAGLPTYAPRNPLGLAFPTPRGCRRQRSKTPTGWEKLVALLGPARLRHDGHGVRWHDLRHTCASSLVAGWWGRPWRIEEVREMLGHSSVVVSERYAHMAPGVLSAAASATPGVGMSVPTKQGDRTMEVSEIAGRATHDSNVRPLPSEGRDIPSLLAAVHAAGGRLGGHEERLRRAVGSRHRNARTIALELAAAARDYRAAVERLLQAEAGPALRAVKGGRS